MKKPEKNFVITLNGAEGTCDTPLFKKMIAKADVTSTPVKDLVRKVFTPIGSAYVHIKTKDKEFDRQLIDTKEYGIIHTSSETFADGFADYRGECDCMRIVEVQAKLGTCYKCVPVITATEAEQLDNAESDNEEVNPFN